MRGLADIARRHGLDGANPRVLAALRDAFMLGAVDRPRRRRAAKKAAADPDRARRIATEMREGGATFRAIAEHLNDLRLETPRGRPWSEGSARYLLGC